MAISDRDTDRQMRALARRVRLRWLEYRRRHPGMSVPINDTLSRILEHDPDYRPPRPRTAASRRPPLRNPGVFTLKEIAQSLRTTVGDLLGEAGYSAVRDVLPAAERRKLRDAVALLRDLFDLDDDALGPAPAPPDRSAAGFVVRDFHAPEPLHAWVVPDSDGTMDNALPLENMREVVDPRILVLRLANDSMAPELTSGATLLVDTSCTTPDDGDLVAVYVAGEGGIVGRWQSIEGKHLLVRSNAGFPPVSLDGLDWSLLGVARSRSAG